MKRIFTILILAAAASMLWSARAEYNEDDAIVFKGQWMKRYVLLPENYKVEDNKRIVVENDDMTLRVNRDGLITKLIYDVHNNTKKTITFPIRRSFIRIGDKVYPMKSRGETTADDIWEVAKMKKKKKFVRRYVETSQAVPFHTDHPVDGEIFIPYKVDGVSKSVQIKFQIIPYEKAMDEEDD